MLLFSAGLLYRPLDLSQMMFLEVFYLVVEETEARTRLMCV